MKISTLILILSLVIFVTSLKLRVHPANSKLQDGAGRYIVMHGVNVVYK
jgi:hypothetical protein